MWMTKTVLESLSLLLPVGAKFCIYQAHTETEMGRCSKMKGQRPRENEYKKFCLNGGKCYYLIDGDIVGCNCTRLYGEN